MKRILAAVAAGFVLAVLAVWLLTPVLLCFTPRKTARWANPANIPAILSEWYMEQTGGGWITITDADGNRTVITTRNGKIVSVSGDGDAKKALHDFGELLHG